MEWAGALIETVSASAARDGILKPATSEWAFPASMVPKPSGEGLRLVCDIRKLNEVTKQDMFEPPGCDLCLEWMQQMPPLTDLYGGEPELEALLIQLTEEVNGSAHYELEIPEWTLWGKLG